MDRLTEQNNGFEIGETEKTCGKWCREVLTSRTTRQRLLSLCPATFLQLQFCYVYDFTDVDECKGNHSCHVNAACMNTLGSHVCQCHAGYTGNGANCTGKFNLFSTICRIVLHDTFDYSAAPFSCVARQLDNLSRRNSVILSSRVHLLECSSRYLMRI